MSRERVAWPPRIGETIHLDSGCECTSGEYEVRGVVDRVMVLRNNSRYSIISAFALSVWESQALGCEDDQIGYFYGPLEPRDGRRP